MRKQAQAQYELLEVIIHIVIRATISINNKNIRSIAITTIAAGTRTRRATPILITTIVIRSIVIPTLSAHI